MKKVTLFQKLKKEVCKENLPVKLLYFNMEK